MSLKVMMFFLLAAILVVFTYQNQVLIDVRFLKWEIKEVPLFIILLLGLIFGFLSALIMQLPRMRKLKSELKRVIREVENSEKIEPVTDEKIDSEGTSMGKDYKGGFFNE